MGKALSAGEAGTAGAPQVACTRPLSHTTIQPWLLALLVALLLLSAVPGIITAQETASPAASLPPATLDALNPGQWSLGAGVVTPGQRLRITNRGVLPHTFTVAEWGIEIDLPTLETVEIVVPSTVSPGDRFTFYCSVGNHRSQGQEGTIAVVSVEEMTASAAGGRSATGAAQSSLRVEMRDDYTFTPAQITASPGQIIELRNTGVLEHHFVVDAWHLNVTVAPGGTSLALVPVDAEVGQVVTFSCSMPGHRQQGMSGQLSVVTAGETAREAPRGRQPSHGPDLGRFVPDASVFSPEWQQVRTGNARAIVPDLDNLNVRIFPGEGRGAAYTGPNGSRAAIVVLPFVASAVPTNQLDDAVVAVQTAMTASWRTSGGLGATYDKVPNPPGCDVVDRIGGVTNLYTLPAGGTSCQLRGPGIVIFVVVEGEVGAATSVQASDLVTERLLQHVVAGDS